MNEKRRNNDNGIRKYIPNPNWIVVVLLILGYAVMLIANIKTIPALTNTVRSNELDINTLKANYRSIKDDLKEIKKLIKERR